MHIQHLHTHAYTHSVPKKSQSAVTKVLRETFLQWVVMHFNFINSHIHCRSSSISETVQDKDIVSTGHQIAAILMTVSVLIASLFEWDLCTTWWASHITSCGSLGGSWFSCECIVL